MKTDGRLGRNPLKGALDDALHAVMYGAERNSECNIGCRVMKKALFSIA